MQFPWLKTTSYRFAALEELGNLNSLDVEKVYVHSLDNDKTGGEFLVHDERLGKRFHVKSTFPQVTIMPPHVLKCALPIKQGDPSGQASTHLDMFGICILLEDCNTHFTTFVDNLLLSLG